MRIATRVAGAAGAAAFGMMALGGAAFADGDQDNNGINALNNDNVSAVPVQLCGNNVGAVIGVVVPIGSPIDAKCVNAPQEQ